MELLTDYQNLLDMEALLIDKAFKFLSDRYDEELAQHMLDVLDSKHGLSIESKPDEDQPTTPLAVGAMTADA